MKIVIVIQRYGADIGGGAERHCRGVAEGLASRGHEIEVLTTCARSYLTWANAYPEGLELLNGVHVRRFRTEREREMDAFNARSAELFGKPHTREDENAWIDSQGPYVPRLLDYLHGMADDRDRLVFFTYLYYPTVHGIHAAPRRSVLVSTTHDEAPLYLSIYEPVFALPAGLIFGTEAEAALVRRTSPRLSSKSAVIGVGIDNLEQLLAQDPRPRDDGVPTVLYVGRVEAGKGVSQLLDYLRRYRGDTGQQLRATLIGELAMELPEEDWIEALGFVSEREKIRRLKDATVAVAPSALESFSLVTLEAMAAGTPVLVNAASEAAVEHCRRGNAGLYYRSYADFREALSLLLGDGRLRRSLAGKGASYVRSNYSWPKIVERYENFLTGLLSP